MKTQRAPIIKPIVHIDMDGVIADFDKMVHLLGERDPERGECAAPPEYFYNLPLVEGSKEALHELDKYYEIFILSTPQWKNTLSWTEKVRWIQLHFPDLLHKKVTLTHYKKLLIGDYLIDDNVHEGFRGTHIHFGTDEFPDWKSVVKYLVDKAKAREEFNKKFPYKGRGTVHV